MSVSKDLRAFIAARSGVTISKVLEGQVTESISTDDGLIWFVRNSTERPRTFEQATGPPERQFFDFEIYHPDPDVVESHANILHNLDGYVGSFGDGRVQGIFVDSQTDEYVPRIEFTDDVALESSFINIEIRSYTE